MKKFLTATILLALLLLGARYAVFHRGLYLDLRPDQPITAAFYTEGNSLCIRDAAGESRPFTLRGVDLASSMAGHFPADYAPQTGDYLRWLGLIQDMGANAVRIHTIYDADFYEAFYLYNTGREEPLYLLQGLQVSDAGLDSPFDAYGADFYPALLEDAVAAVDVIHGRRDLASGGSTASGSYRRDVSPWVLGFVVGNGWESGVVAYTDNRAGNPASYQGAYFSTAPGATPFEAILAEVLDTLARYEGQKYKQQRLYAFGNDAANDFLRYQPHYAQQLGKYVHLDAEHIRPGPSLAGGYFAAYRPQPIHREFYRYLTAAQQQALGPLLPGESAAAADQYALYPALLAGYHTMPVAILGCAISSARGVAEPGGPYTEQEQGALLCAAYDSFLAGGCCGMSIASWQDEWGRNSWNTHYGMDIYTACRWQDVESAQQGYGLLAFEPGEAGATPYPDGSRDEWAAEHLVLETPGLSLYAQYDEKGLYLLLEGAAPDIPLYIPIDTIQGQGSALCAAPGLSFSRPADFLLCLEGGQGRLLVQARYDFLREAFLHQTEGTDPFVSYPPPDDPSFLPIRMALGQLNLVEAGATEAEAAAAQQFATLETGLLRPGDANPRHAAYDSLADYCWGDGFVEIRLPWQLLNFYDPSVMAIHGDYYTNYGVEGQRIDRLYLGACAGPAGAGGAIRLHPLALQGWGDAPTSHERLKASYYILQAHWEDGHGV